MKLRFYVEYAGISFLDEIFRVLSWESSQGLGAAIGSAASLVMGKRWKMTLKNLEAAFPEKSAEEREAIGLEAWRNAGRIGAEFFKSRHLSSEELRRIVRVENMELCDRLFEEGKGIIVNIGHMGNWEVGGIAVTERGFPLGVVGRSMKNPWIEEFIRETRSRCGEVVFGHHNPFFSSVKWLKQNKAIAVLIDHNLYEGGIFVPFFGRPAATSTLSALLAIKLGTPVVSVFARREGPHITVRFDGPLRADPQAHPEKEAERLTAAMTAALEGYVRQRPGEWLWGHNRWKRKPA